MKLILQSFILLLSFIIIFVWQNSFLATYTVPLLGGMIALYLIIAARKKGAGFLSLGGEGPWGIFLLNTVIFLLIFSTGSITSPLFFLLYFLGFGVAFVFEPVITFVFVLGAVIVLLPDALQNDVTDSLIKLSSLILISPLAFFFGREYRQNEKENEEIEALKERTKDSADTISEDIEEVIKDERENLKDKDMQKLNEILEETEDLRAESTQ